jgi:recombination DNA repair RAD52 pathway protein
MNIETLQRPFSPHQIKQRKGSFGNTLEYIEGHTVISRLNDAFESNWSFKIISHEILENEVVVLGELTAENIRKSQFGCSAIARNKDSGKVISLGSDLKAASTDSLKRCAMLLGIGLHLYSKDNGSTGAVASNNPDKDRNNTNSSSNSGTNYMSTTPPSTTPIDTHSTTTHSSTNQNGRISSKQHKYLISLGQERGLSKHDLNRRSIDGYGSAIAYLSKQQASELIQSMQQH